MRAESPTVGTFTGYGPAISALRAARQMTQEQVAERAGVGVRSLTNVEQEARDARLSTLDAILAALGVDIFAFAAAVARAQGLEIPESVAMQTREGERARFRRSVDAETPPDGDPIRLELRKLQDRIQDLEARLYGTTPRVTPNPAKPD